MKEVNDKEFTDNINNVANEAFASFQDFLKLELDNENIREVILKTTIFKKNIDELSDALKLESKHPLENFVFDEVRSNTPTKIINVISSKKLSTTDLHGIVFDFTHGHIIQHTGVFQDYFQNSFKTHSKLDLVIRLGVFLEVINTIFNILTDNAPKEVQDFIREIYSNININIDVIKIEANKEQFAKDFNKIK